MATPADADGRSGIQVLARAIEILRLLNAYPAGLSQTEIGERLGLARSTVSRLLMALEAEDFVVALGPRGRYRLGPELVRLAASARRSAWLDLHPLLVGMSEEIGETVDLSVLEGDRAVFVDQVVADNRLRAVSSVGDSFPLHASANGKAFLAALPEVEVKRILAGRLDALTANTLTTPGALRADLDGIRARGGVAMDVEEQSEGVCAVGAVVGHLDHDLLAVSIPVPVQRFVGREDELVAAVADFAVRISDWIAASGERLPAR
jgi:DNA-binding IclR family transcriptional regulator